MRWMVLFAMLTSMLGCTFDDRSYDGTSFACDAEHACPDGQTCVAGQCSEQSAVGDGVACGSAGTCVPGEVCCALLTDSRCIPAGDACTGTTAACDGPEDCADDQACCATSDAACSEASSCTTLACTDANDCGGIAPNCCFFAGMPWGVCSVC